eukprot:239888-Pelagomonas_calceolata.AAC.1
MQPGHPEQDLVSISATLYQRSFLSAFRWRKLQQLDLQSPIASPPGKESALDTEQVSLLLCSQLKASSLAANNPI